MLRALLLHELHKSFKHLNDLRTNDVIVYYHDETWTNSDDERRYVWIDEKDEGRLRKSEGQGDIGLYLNSKIIEIFVFF